MDPYNTVTTQLVTYVCLLLLPDRQFVEIEDKGRHPQDTVYAAEFSFPALRQQIDKLSEKLYIDAWDNNLKRSRGCSQRENHFLLLAKANSSLGCHYLSV